MPFVALTWAGGSALDHSGGARSPSYMRGILLDGTLTHSYLSFTTVRVKNEQPWLHHSVLQTTRMKDVNELITRSTVKFLDSIVTQSFGLFH